MKVAILFPGLIRTYSDTHKSFFDNVINPNQKNHEIDVYLSFWNFTHNRNMTVLAKNVRDRIDEKNLPASGGIDTQELDSEEIKRIVDIYKPKRFEVMKDYHQKNIEFKQMTNELVDILGMPKLHGPILIQNGIIAQPYTWFKAYSLISGNYDMIIKSRFDITYDRPLDFNSLNMKELNCTKNRQYDVFGLSDHFFGANPEIMKMIMKDYHQTVCPALKAGSWESLVKEYNWDNSLRKSISILTDSSASIGEKDSERQQIVDIFSKPCKCRHPHWVPESCLSHVVREVFSIPISTIPLHVNIVRAPFNLSNYR